MHDENSNKAVRMFILILNYAKTQKMSVVHMYTYNKGKGRARAHH